MSGRSGKTGFSSILDRATFGEKFSHVKILGPDQKQEFFGDSDDSILSDELVEILTLGMIPNLARLHYTVNRNNEKSMYFHVNEILTWITALGKVNNEVSIQTVTGPSILQNSSSSDILTAAADIADIDIDPNSIYITHENALAEESKAAKGPVEFILTQGLLKTSREQAESTFSGGSTQKRRRPPTPSKARSTSPSVKSSAREEMTSTVSSRSQGIAAIVKEVAARIVLIVEVKKKVADDVALEADTDNDMFQLYSQMAVAMERNRRNDSSDPVYGILTNGFAYVFVQALSMGNDVTSEIRMTRSERLVFLKSGDFQNPLFRPCEDTRTILYYLVKCLYGNTFQGRTDLLVSQIRSFQQYTADVAEKFLRRTTNILEKQKKMSDKNAELQNKLAAAIAEIEELKGAGEKRKRGEDMAEADKNEEDEESNKMVKKTHEGK